MIAGLGKTAGRTFELQQFNDKHPMSDPVTGAGISPTLFFTTTLGFAVNAGTPLPSLGFSRVYVLTGPGTCSASEAILNGLSGVDVQVFQIGKTTCGKPYGFYPEDNCGTTYFSIQFRGVNAKGYGDYADGFAPGATTTAGFPGCTVSDDFGHALGDAAEAQLATALGGRALARGRRAARRRRRNPQAALAAEPDPAPLTRLTPCRWSGSSRSRPARCPRPCAKPGARSCRSPWWRRLRDRSCADPPARRPASRW
jgi:hypothetical protein